jgi:DNA-binding NtrC family response regulator
MLLSGPTIEEEMQLTIRKSILVVDDESDLRLLLAHELLNIGYEIREASDGAEAIELLKKYSFDLALLDIQMPSVNGIQVLKYIREHSPKTKAIMLTGYADLKHAMEAKEYGATDFIGKPYKIDDITSTIERLLKE